MFQQQHLERHQQMSEGEEKEMMGAEAVILCNYRPDTQLTSLTGPTQVQLYHTCEQQ